MEKDGTFKWVDKEDIEFSNWSPNFPRNTDHFWDCGQIYTGEREKKRKLLTILIILDCSLKAAVCNIFRYLGTWRPLCSNCHYKHLLKEL